MPAQGTRESAREELSSAIWASLLGSLYLEVGSQSLLDHPVLDFLFSRELNLGRIAVLKLPPIFELRAVEVFILLNFAVFQNGV